MSSDDAIRATNDDAASCKRFAVQQGYWKDPYIQHFVRSADRKAPEINRGYYARVTGVRTLLRKFLYVTKCNCQVISLGAGYDTTYWVLKDEGLTAKNYVEFDFPGVTSKKCNSLKRSKVLLEKIVTEEEDIKLDRYNLHASDYHVVAGDLRSLTEVDKQLQECGIDKSLPTLILAECVLVYMDSHHSRNLLEWFAKNFKHLFFVNYEQVNMTDRFGQVMIDNLRGRQCGLNGIDHCASIQSQKNRFLSTGWSGADAMEMSNVYKLLPQAEVQQIEKLEFLDERELMEQLFQHYCLCWAFKGGEAFGLESISLEPCNSS